MGDKPMSYKEKFQKYNLFIDIIITKAMNEVLGDKELVACYQSVANPNLWDDVYDLIERKVSAAVRKNIDNARAEKIKENDAALRKKGRGR